MSEEKQKWLIKEEKYFKCKKRDNIPYDYSKKEKIAAISQTINKSSDSQKKE